jgi:hypothetical protein
LKKIQRKNGAKLCIERLIPLKKQTCYLVDLLEDKFPQGKERSTISSTN